MNIVILGAGSIGSYLADHLSKRGHNVIVVDHAQKPLERLAETADVATRLGSGTDWNLLDELREYDPYLFIAVSSDDETNLVACTLAKNLGYPKTACRIRQGNYLNRTKLDFSRLFSVDYLIGSELIVAHDILKQLLYPQNASVENFVHGSVQMRTLKIPATWEQANQKIMDLALPSNLLIGLIHRKIGMREEIIFPTGGDLLHPGDEITLIGDAKAMVRIPELFSVADETIRSAMIIGGSTIAIHTAKLLDEHGIRVKIIDGDEKRCQKMAEELPLATILNHEPTDVHFLMTEKLDKQESVICVTESHETNILLASLAKQMGCPKVVPLVSEEGYLPFLRHLGITKRVSERESIANRIDSIIQASPLVSISSLYGDRVKIMEVKVSIDSEIVGIPLADLRAHLPRDFLFALIQNRGRVMIPKGHNILTPGDSVIVICHPKHLEELEKVF
jgi:trk system potassium uptake protein TrkA